MVLVDNGRAFPALSGIQPSLSDVDEADDWVVSL